MNNLRVFCWIAALACSAPVYSQECSCGATGGMDVTGNECNTDVVASSNVSSVESPQPRAKMVGKERLVAVGRPASRMLRPAAATEVRMVAAAPVNRFPEVATPPVERVMASKIENGRAAECSGGAGGMDATGNECNDVSVYLAVTH